MDYEVFRTKMFTFVRRVTAKYNLQQEDIEDIVGDMMLRALRNSAKKNSPLEKVNFGFLFSNTFATLYPHLSSRPRIQARGVPSTISMNQALPNSDSGTTLQDLIAYVPPPPEEPDTPDVALAYRPRHYQRNYANKSKSPVAVPKEFHDNPFDKRRCSHCERELPTTRKYWYLRRRKGAKGVKWSWGSWCRECVCATKRKGRVTYPVLERRSVERRREQKRQYKMRQKKKDTRPSCFFCKNKAVDSLCARRLFVCGVHKRQVHKWLGVHLAAECEPNDISACIRELNAHPKNTKAKLAEDLRSRLSALLDIRTKQRIYH